MVCEPPLRPPSLAVLSHVLLNELLGLRQRLRSSRPHETHGLRIGVHFKQGVDVSWNPGRQQQALGLEDDVAIPSRCCASLLHDRRVKAGSELAELGARHTRLDTGCSSDSREAKIGL